MIFVECDPDEVLVKALGITRKNITHEADKPKVIKKVMKAESEARIGNDNNGKEAKVRKFWPKDGNYPSNKSGNSGV